MSHFFKSAPHVAFVGASTEAGSATPTLVARKDDLILAFAVEAGTTAIPVAPAGLGWIAVGTDIGANALGSAVAYRRVTADGEGHGTWTGTLRGIFLQAFRNVDWKDPIGAVARAHAAAAVSVSHAALTLETKNCMVATGALVSSGAGPGLRSDATLSKEVLSTSPRIRHGRSTTRRVRSWGAQVVGNDGATSAASAYYAVELRGRRRG